MVAWCSLSVRFSIFSYVEWSFVGFLSSGICLFVSFAQALSFDRPPTQVQIPALQNLRRNRGRIIKRGGGTFEKQAPREGGHPLPLLIDPRTLIMGHIYARIYRHIYITAAPMTRALG